MDKTFERQGVAKFEPDEEEDEREAVEGMRRLSLKALEDQWDDTQRPGDSSVVGCRFDSCCPHQK